MGGGGKPQNIFRLRLGEDPREVLNWRLWFAVLSFGIMGAARGIDEGLVNGTFKTKHFQNSLHLKALSASEYANVHGNVVGMVQIGSVVGALLAFVVADRIGRLWATRQLCLLWILGIVIFLTNGGRLGQVYAGRFIAGIGIGETTVIAPVYIAEIAPRSVRGLCTCVFAGSVYIGIMLAYFAVWGSSLHLNQNSPKAWIIPTSIHLMFAGLIFILSFFNYESPRYLVKQGKTEHAITNLARIRGLPADHEVVVREIRDIQKQLEEEQEATMGGGFFGVVKEIFLIPKNAFRLYLGLGTQLLSQWSGASSITIYAVDFFALLGTKGQRESLFATAIFGVVKFVAAITCALFLVDVIGRKRSLSIGIALQAIAILYIASFLTAVPNLGEEGYKLTASQKPASVGAIVMIYVSGFGWAMGWNSVQYLINAEIYPLRIRAITSSVVMCFHFINQWANSKAVPTMLLDPAQGGLSAKGTFWLFFAITAIGGVWVWFTIPETAGLSLEQMDHVFSLPWWKIGLFGRREAEVQFQIERERELEEKVEPLQVERVEAGGKV
ncbi:hypothetical protein BAUCODRAFT_70045 [Baudoinia panamericana UAMH 10762]|uniref:Major facilitator superfamily (MFS) profile domain-containing protein n=1 Tax=Baudoinia panamericana (strain UAMH 10762) TaxID=717646 RepID=M2MIM2_BAUPA|nr:uncharacterized protein BAUCODRAFT_70045 [Baudoinia panamericana UAMH 10762]EMC96496.1 hypothetical protein BAUCODRAFT_70045 [Baudoinia panamericana UAMH 10762]